MSRAEASTDSSGCWLRHGCSRRNWMDPADGSSMEWPQRGARAAAGQGRTQQLPRVIRLQVLTNVQVCVDVAVVRAVTSAEQISG